MGIIGHLYLEEVDAPSSTKSPFPTCHLPVSSSHHCSAASPSPSFATAGKYTLRVFAPLVEADQRPPASAKSRLQEWLQGRGLDLPEYRTVSAIGPAHQPVFVVSVSAAGREAEGMGDTRRAAEQAAAEAWLAEVERR